MLPQKMRVTKDLFEDVLTQGQTINAPFFYVRMYDTKKPENSRFSIVVPKKVAPKAVLRNKLRRQVSSVIEKNIKSLIPSKNVVVFFKKGAEKLAFTDITSQINTLFSRARLCTHC